MRSAPHPAQPAGLAQFTDERRRGSGGLDLRFREKTRLKEMGLVDAFEDRPSGGRGREVLDGPAVYEFRIAPGLPERWTAWFDGLDIAHDEQGNTLLSGTIVDQAALHGVLTKIRDLNLILLSVVRK
jgi:hypothetical protein